MRHASARVAGLERLTGGPWWFNNNLISPSGVLPTLALEFATIEGGRFMTGGVNRTFTGAINLTRTNNASFFGDAGILQTAITDVARFDHNPVTGARLGLLGEEGRTNLVKHSSAPTTSPWASADTTIGVNETTAPDGTSTAASVIHTSGGNVNQPITVTVSDYAVSLFVKPKSGGGFLRLFSINAALSTFFSSHFNLGTGAWGATSSGGNGSFTSNRVESLKDGWSKITIVGSTGSTTAILFRYYITDSDGSGTRSTTKSLYVWGAGLEDDVPFDSSHIPTVGSTVTRNADVLSLVADGSLPHPGYNQTENTITGKCTLTDVTTEQVIVSYSDGTTDDRVELFVVSGSLKARVFVGTNAKAAITLGAVTARTEFSWALSWIANALRGSLNGATEVNDTTTNTIPSVSQCNLNSQLGTTSLVGQSRWNRYHQYPTAFSGSTLEALAAL